MLFHKKSRKFHFWVFLNLYQLSIDKQTEVNSVSNILVPLQRTLSITKGENVPL